jgi:hypothetical protein
VCVCRVAFLFWWTLERATTSFCLSLRLEKLWMVSLHYGKWTHGFGMKRKSLFLDFWHIKNDFALLIAKNIIFKAEKAQSYSSLHALSNATKICACLCRNRLEKSTGSSLSMVIIHHRHHHRAHLARGPI